MQDKERTDAELDKFLNFMSRHGLNVTAQRRIIARAFFEYPGHHTLEEFFQHVRKIDKSIGQTTVYRTLKLLCDAKLAMEIHLKDDITRYEILSPNSHHDHIMCVGCEKIIEIYDPRIEKLQKEIAEQNHFTLQGHFHVMYGLCEECQKQKKNGTGSTDEMNNSLEQ